MPSSVVSKFKSYGKLFLIGIDIAFILSSIVIGYNRPPDDPFLFSISLDAGYAEYFQYTKLGAIILLLFFAAIAIKSAVIGGWSIIFSILLADDRLAIHENVGEWLANTLTLQPMFNLRPVDYGETMVYVLWGVIATAILVTASRLDRTRIARQTSKGLLLAILGLICFGGLFDMAHIMARNTWKLSNGAETLFAAIEDGGEMIVITLALCFAYSTYQNARLLQNLNSARKSTQKTAGSPPYADTKRPTAPTNTGESASESSR